MTDTFFIQSPIARYLYREMGQVEEVDCPPCKGTGKFRYRLRMRRCWFCNGTGRCMRGETNG